MARQGLRYNTRVAFNQRAIEQLRESVEEGLYDAAKEGKQRQLDIASTKFRTMRGFTRGAFAAGFDEDGERFAEEGPAPQRMEGKGPVAYFGYNWFVARFYETGTARQRPRPSAAPAAAEIEGRLPGYLQSAARRRGFTRHG